jgi:hypothetical protein
MPNERMSQSRVQVFLDFRTTALIHKLMATGIYHARLSQDEFDVAKRGQALLEDVLMSSNYYSESELRMVLDSTAKIFTVPL